MTIRYTKTMIMAIVILFLPGKYIPVYRPVQLSI